MAKTISHQTQAGHASSFFTGGIPDLGAGSAPVPHKTRMCVKSLMSRLRDPASCLPSLIQRLNKRVSISLVLDDTYHKGSRSRVID